MRYRKGQYLSMEQMMLFSLGVILTVSVYISFSSITETITDTVREDQLTEVGNLVRSGIEKAHTTSETGVDYVNISVEIPGRIGGDPYKIKIIENEILVVQDKHTSTVDLGDMERVETTPGISSAAEQLYVVSEGGSTGLER